MLKTFNTNQQWCLKADSGTKPKYFASIEMLDAKSAPLLQFGVIADVQYADNDDKPAWYNPSKTRYYRNSLNQLEQAFNYWDKKNVRFVLQLGDIIDALSKSICSHSAIHRTLRYFLNNPDMPAFHTVGNLFYFNS